MVRTNSVKVLVSHPGRQHSHQAAIALERRGMLAAYWAGVPSRAEQQKWIPEALRRRFIRYAPVDIPDELARWLPVAVSLRKWGRALHFLGIESNLDFMACRAYDKQVARNLGLSGATAVIACEISALDTFRTAKRLGMRTVLDAPSMHFATQDRARQPAKPTRFHERILGIKQAEIGLADHILTVSELARASYIEAGVDGKRVHAIALGADVELFKPCVKSGSENAKPRSFSFVFAGTTQYGKGVDILLDAFRRVEQQLPGAASLIFVGPRGDAAQLIDHRKSASLKLLPPVTQEKLRDVMCEANCLVLPSRLDSFGMVVAEAMACGLPVIVSNMVGAKEIIDEGINGWVVPVADVAVLTQRMIWCVKNGEAVASMRTQARAAAERYSWEAYRDRYAKLIEDLLEGGC